LNDETDFSFYEQGSRVDLMAEGFDDSSADEQLLDQEFPPDGLLSDDQHDAMDVDLKTYELEEMQEEEQRGSSYAMATKASSATPKVTRTSTRLKQQKQAVLQKLNTTARRGSRESLGGGATGGRRPSTPTRGSGGEELSAKSPLTSSGSPRPSTPLSQQSTPQKPLSAVPKTPVHTGSGSAVLGSRKSPSGSLNSASSSTHIESQKVLNQEEKGQLRDELIKLHRQHLRDTTDMNKVESKLLVNLTMKMGKQILNAPNETLEKQIEESFDGYLNELGDLLVKKQESISAMLELIHSLKKQ
jgi:hypothetical protein